MVVYGAVERGAAFHTLCVGLVVADIVARSFRFGIVMRAMQTPIPLRDSFTLTLFGDAAAALTPWRIGGEPARVFGAVHAGSPASTAVIGLGVESMVVYTVLTLIGIALAAAFGAEWAMFLRRSVSAVSNPVTLGVAAVIVALGVFVFSRLPSHIAQRARAFVVRAVRELRRMRARDLAAIAALSTVSLVTRIAILPGVVAAFGERPPVGVVWLASFALLNGQLLTPTPSGAGAVELAAATGFIGTEQHTAGVLATWRLYTAILPIAGGLLCGAVRYGPRALLIIVKRGEPS